MLLLMSAGGLDSIFMLSLIALFIFLTYVAGRLSRVAGLSPIIGEILTGVLLGPEVLNIIPYAGKKSNNNHIIWNDHDLLNIWGETGTIGVTLMIMESGMHVKFEKMFLIWKESLGVAILGTLLPVVSGMLCIELLVPGSMYPSGFAAGIALAPTSVGIAIKLLEENEQMNTMPGQTILAAAFLDDIFSLILLVIMINISSDHFTAASIILPTIEAFAYVGVAALLAKKVMPRLVPRAVHFVKLQSMATLQPRDELQLSLMIVLLVGCAIIGAIIGSHLLGAFVAGLLFVNVPRSHLIWKRQLKHYIKLTVRLFFAATVAFSIKLSVMFTFEAFLKGVVVGLVPTILAKLVAGLAYIEKDARTSYRKRLSSLVVGAAMVGRGEFAYYVAEVAANAEMSDGNKMMSKEVHAVVLWALIFSTIFAPIVFQKALGKYIANKPKIRAGSIGGGLTNASKSKFAIRMIGKHHTGVMREILNALHEFNLDVVEIHAENDGLTDVDVFTVEPRGDNKDLDEESLKEICHVIEEVVDDPHAVILFEPVDMDVDVNKHLLEIEVIGEHHSDVLHEITDILSALDLEVSKAFVETRADTHGHTIEVDVFYAKPTNERRLSSHLRAKVREELMHVIESHHLKGEVLVKVIHIDECHASHSITTFPRKHKVTVVKCEGPHHKELLHEICDLLADLDLDVLKADIDRFSENVDSLDFYVTTRDTSVNANETGDENNKKNMPLRDDEVKGMEHTVHSKNNVPKVVDHVIRSKIRRCVAELYLKHNTKCTVSVRPYHNIEYSTDNDSESSGSEAEDEKIVTILDTNEISLSAGSLQLNNRNSPTKLLPQKEIRFQRSKSNNSPSNWNAVKQHLAQRKIQHLQENRSSGELPAKSSFKDTKDKTWKKLERYSPESLIAQVKIYCNNSTVTSLSASYLQEFELNLTAKNNTANDIQAIFLEYLFSYDQIHKWYFKLHNAVFSGNDISINHMLGVSFLIGMIRLFQSLYKKYKIDTHKMNEWIAEGINQYDGDGLISDWLDDFQKLLNILVGNLDVFESMVQ